MPSLIMRLAVLFTPFEVVFSVARRPERAARWQLRLSGLMILVAILAVSLWLSTGYLKQRRALRGPTIVMTYSVSDLVQDQFGPMPTSRSRANLQQLASALKASVTPRAWGRGPEDASITPFFLNHSLIIRHTKAGHRQVKAWMIQKRRSLSSPGPKS